MCGVARACGGPSAGAGGAIVLQPVTGLCGNAAWLAMGVLLGHCGAGAALVCAANVRTRRGARAPNPPSGPGGTALWHHERRRGHRVVPSGDLGGLSGAPVPKALQRRHLPPGSAVLQFRRHYRGDTFPVVMAEVLAPWLRPLCYSRRTVAGDQEKFANAWRRWVEGQYCVQRIMHLLPPPRLRQYGQLPLRSLWRKLSRRRH